MNWLESLLYGLVSGFTEFLPVSAAAHQSLMQRIFGAEGTLDFRNLLVHSAILAALCFSCRPIFSGLRNQPATALRGRTRAPRRAPELRIVRTAAVPILLSFAVSPMIKGLSDHLLLLALFLVLNGLVLFAQGRMYCGNKTAGAMSGWDSLLIGLGGALAVLPGISRIGTAVTVAVGRGADRQHSLDWSLLLSIPALVVIIIIDLFGVFANGTGVSTVAEFLTCLLSAAGSCCGGYFGIMLMRFLAVKTGFSGFSYYSWGAALFSVVLYLTVV